MLAIPVEVVVVIAVKPLMIIPAIGLVANGPHLHVFHLVTKDTNINQKKEGLEESGN